MALHERPPRTMIGTPQRSGRTALTLHCATRESRVGFSTLTCRAGMVFMSRIRVSPAAQASCLFVVVTIVCSSLSCDQAAPPRAEGDASVLGIHQFLAAAHPTKQLGEDCSVGGGSDCKTDSCIHVSPQPDQGWFCSRSCASAGECPSRWNCSEFYPGVRACIPPDKWTARATTVAAEKQ